MLHGAETQAQENKISRAELRILKLMTGVTRLGMSTRINQTGSAKQKYIGKYITVDWVHRMKIEQERESKNKLRKHEIMQRQKITKKGWRMVEAQDEERWRRIEQGNAGPILLAKN